MQLYVIRHAQSVNNALWAEGLEGERSPDPELTDAGHQQAQLLARFLARSTAGPAPDGTDPHNRRGFGITHLYSSLMLRALTTAHYAAEVMELPLQIWREIHEWGGIYKKDPETGEQIGLPGVTRSVLVDRFKRAQIPDWLGEEGWWNRPYEPREVSDSRAEQFLHELLERHGGSEDRVAIVTHGGFAYSLLSAMLQFAQKNDSLDVPRHVWFMKNNASISRVDFIADYLSLIYMNRVDYLPADLIT